MQVDPNRRLLVTVKRTARRWKKVSDQLKVKPKWKVVYFVPVPTLTFFLEHEFEELIVEKVEMEVMAPRK